MCSQDFCDDELYTVECFVTQQTRWSVVICYGLHVAEFYLLSVP